MATFYTDDAPMGDRYFIDGGSFSREEFERRRETECIHRWVRGKLCRHCGKPDWEVCKDCGKPR